MSPAQRSRHGTSVVEVMIALVLVAIGLLGIAGSTLIALRTTTDIQHRRSALHDAARRIASLQAAGCEGSASGSTVDASTHAAERWSVVRTGDFALATDTIRWQGASAPMMLTAGGIVAC